MRRTVAVIRSWEGPYCSERSTWCRALFRSPTSIARAARMLCRRADPALWMASWYKARFPNPRPPSGNGSLSDRSPGAGSQRLSAWLGPAGCATGTNPRQARSAKRARPGCRGWPGNCGVRNTTPAATPWIPWRGQPGRKGCQTTGSVRACESRPRRRSPAPHASSAGIVSAGVFQLRLMETLSWNRPKRGPEGTTIFRT